MARKTGKKRATATKATKPITGTAKKPKKQKELSPLGKVIAECKERGISYGQWQVEETCRLIKEGKLK